MGYRSDVHVLMHEKDWAVIKADALIHGVDIDFHRPPIAHRTAKNDKKIIEIHYLGVKWYTNYDEIRFLSNHFERLHDEAEDFAFCRVGENAEDIVAYQTGCLYLNTYVEIDAEIDL